MLNLIRSLILFNKTPVHGHSFSTPKPPYDAIPQAKRPHYVQYWWLLVQHINTSPQKRDNITITKVQWLKETGGLGHETLIFEVNVAVPVYTTFLAVERLTDQKLVENALENEDALLLVSQATGESANEADKQRIQSALRKALKEELNLIKIRDIRTGLNPMHPNMDVNSESPPPFQEAIDIVSQANHLYLVEPTPASMNAECLDIFTFNNSDTSKFTLRDLAIMVREIISHAPGCSLTEHNSNWFARTLVDVIVRMKHPTIQTPEQAPNGLAGCFANNPDIGRIMTSNPIEVDELVVKIEQSIQADDERISDSMRVQELVKKTQEQEARIAAMQGTVNQFRAQSWARKIES